MATKNEIEAEKEIQAKGLNAPRVTHDVLDLMITKIEYSYIHSAPKLITVCILTLKNGFKVTGVNHSAVSPENYDKELGEKYANEKAREQIWPLEGYLLAQKLYEAKHHAKKIV